MTHTLDERSAIVLMVGLPFQHATGSGAAVSHQNRDRAVRVRKWA
jgi:hypothetical protein